MRKFIPHSAFCIMITAFCESRLNFNRDAPRPHIVSDVVLVVWQVVIHASPKRR
jgi:hypothetical protein